MKQKDLILIGAIALFSAVASWLISTKVFVAPTNRQQPVEVVDVIKADFPLPDKRFFNTDSINPTTNSGLEDTNNNPFNGTTQ